MTNLINLSFSTGLFPKILKQARIIPIFYKGDQQDCNNYRPISLSQNVSKLLKNSFIGSFTDFLNTNQFGFHYFHSANHALITVTEKIRKAIDNGKITYGAFLDYFSQN